MKNKIWLILSESYLWRNRDLIESEEFINPKLSFRKLITNNIILSLLASIISIYFGNLINPEFAGYTITALSIFVGLFTTILILIFDKFINNTILTQKKEKVLIINGRKNLSESQVRFIKTKNFSRKFVFVSLEGLLIAIAVIVLFLVPLMLKNNFTINIFDYSFTFKELSRDSFGTFFLNLLILSVRIFLIILLFKFFKYLINIFSLLGSYIKGVFDNHVDI